jgi:RNA polymerase sigma-70 factor (ECF subfamily)
MASLSATDERLLRQLYQDHAGALLRYVGGLVGGDLARAEDVVQETLLRAWQHPQALDPDRPGGSSVRAWLLTVARHLVVDGERARRARPREVAGPEVLNGATHAEQNGSAGADAFEQVLLAHGVAEALQALSPAHREVLEELYFHDRTVSEAARHLGVPEGTVKSRAYYALRALRVACEERGLLP